MHITIRTLLVGVVLAAPSVTIGQTAGGVATKPVTPAELAYGLQFHGIFGLGDTTSHALVPRSQLDKALQEKAEAWVSSLVTTAASGLQLDPLGQLHITIGRDSEARAAFDTRLKTAGLSVNDRAYTLLFAIGL